MSEPKAKSPSGETQNPTDGPLRGLAVSSGTRANAITHGLTATTLLPSVLQPGRVDELFKQLAGEYQPASPTEHFLIRELARHIGALELCEVAEGGVLRRGATLIGTFTNRHSADQDDFLAAATTTDQLDRLTRYRRTHEKSAHQCIKALLEQRRQRERQAQTRLMEPARFATEEACELHLRARFASPAWRCPTCSSSKGYMIDSRRNWECSNCKRQFGLRSGTVFERSQLPLVNWFAAVRYATANENISAVQLSKLAAIPRLATAQTVLRRIREAMAADNADTQLVGLQAFPLWARTT